MLEKNLNLTTGITKHFPALATAAIFVALLCRNSGIYPVVFADEYIYSMFSRLLPLADSTIPAYLYLAIYRYTIFCGDGYLGCARIFNTLFFVASAPFIYLTARRVCTRFVASITLLLTLLGPINSYTAYYTPEAFYFFSFWLLTWFLLQLDNTSYSRSWCFGGILLGLSALVKPHALFFLPAILVYILYVSRRAEDKWALLAFRNVVYFVVFTFITNLLIGYFFAGRAGITIFGPTYTLKADFTALNFRLCIELLILSIKCLKGHMLAICLMFGVPVAFIINSSLNSMSSRSEAKLDQKMSFYTLMILANIVLVTSLYTAVVSKSGDSLETITRLHMRYYNYALPLLVIIVASKLSLKSTTITFRLRAITAFSISIVILYAIYTHLAPYTPTFFDSPELFGFTFNSTVFYILGGISIFSLAIWVYEIQASAKIFLFLFMPLAVAFSTFYVNHELRQRLVPDVYDKAGIFTKQYLSNDELSKLVIIGSDIAGLYRTSFYIDNPKASRKTISKGVCYDFSEVPINKEWALVIGDYSLPKNTFLKLPLEGFTLMRLSSKKMVDFTKKSWPGVISGTQGLSSAEVWGTWSSSDAVTLEFYEPLPEKFTVYLTARAFGPNVGKEFVIHAGDGAIKFTLSALPEERMLKFNNPKRFKTIKIDIPLPTSPKELGLSDDERKIGIALIELRIGF